MEKIKGRSNDIVLILLLLLAFLVFLKPTLNYTFAFFGFPFSLTEETSYAFMFLTAMAAVVVFAARRKMDIFFGCLTALCALITASTIYNRGELLTIVVDWLPCLGVVSLVALFAKERPRLLLFTFMSACVFYLLCNLMYLLSDPSLIGVAAVDNLVFGYRNVTFRIAIPSVVCSFALDALDKRKITIRTVTIYFLGLFELVVGYSATAMCAFLAMGAVLVVSAFARPIRFLDALSYGIGYVVLFFGLVVLRIQNAFAFIIEPLLHRSVTFTGRTVIWDDAFSHLGNSHFVTGYGTGYIWNTLCINGSPQKHAHNEILNALMLGGVGALVALTGMTALAIGKLYINHHNRVSAAFAVGMLGYFIVALAEVASCPGAFFIMGFAYYYFDWGDQNPFAERAKHFGVEERK